jgi:hypothetical protein
VFTESLDLSRLGKRDEADEGAAYAWLLEKYRDARFDAIVAVEELPLRLALRHRERLAPGAPVLFTSIEQQRAEPYLSEKDVTGVYLELPALQTIELATRLFPQARTVAYIGNKPGINPHFTQQARPIVRKFVMAAGMEFIPLIDLPLADLNARLRSLAPDTLVFYEALWGDSTGGFLRARGGSRNREPGCRGPDLRLQRHVSRPWGHRRLVRRTRTPWRRDGRTPHQSAA